MFILLKEGQEMSWTGKISDVCLRYSTITGCLCFLLCFRSWISEVEMTSHSSGQSILISWKSKMNGPIVVLISVSPYLQITADAIIVCMWQSRNCICSRRRAIPSVHFYNDSKLDQIATWQSNTQYSLCVDEGECRIEFVARKLPEILISA